ncbi:LemA family protein [Candidatus Woesearchaeota archaeon]|nr:LemA family protein [Candidatus Woesearchaeota archaeon]
MDNQTILIILLIILAWFIFTYNRLITMKNYVKKSFSGIDVQLKRRTDLIPNLVSVVKGYAKHEKTIMEEVTKARSHLEEARKRKDVQKMANTESELNSAVKSLFAVSENYPDLKANKNFLDLQKQLRNTEDQIAASRRIYNENVTSYNTKIEIFPSNLLAKLFSFKQEKLYETKERESKKILVNE